MSTLANRPNNSALMSESDNDDDFDQNLSTNQQNESMIHKVKDVVTKFLHPSFLFSAAGVVEPARSKRKRTISTEEKMDDKQFETNGQPITNGNGVSSNLKEHRPNKNDDEAELTDDEISVSSQPKTVGIDQTNNNSEKQTKRRRTANYQHILTPTTATTTNGTHSHEKVPPLTNTTNNVNLSSSRRLHDHESKDTEEAERNSASNLTKPRFNIPAASRSFSSNYDPSQSPLFSVGSRRINETTMSPARTTTNLKSNNNEFSGNQLLVSSLSQRTPVSASVQLNQSISTLSSPNPNNSQRLMSNERQMLGINYASINSRRLPYIERLRRRTLQDCIRLNRTLDNEPLSISTIEEHTSNSVSPRRSSVKAPEKDCGVQCDISTTDNVPEPKRKFQRTFPPADIRDEALSIPITEKTSGLNPMESSIQTHSSITIEPIKSSAAEINKPKVLGNIAAFSWPKFARAQEEYAKKYPDRCRVESVPVPSTSTKSVSFAPSPNKMPIFSASPPRPTRPAAGPIWKCPSCTMEHPAQTASCSMCHGINPNYKRLNVVEPTPKSIESSIAVAVSAEQTTPIITSATMSNVTTSQNVAVSTSAPIFSMPSTNFQPISFTPVTTAAFSAPIPSIPFAITSTETSVTNSPILSTTPTTTTASSSLFSLPAMTSSTTASSSFSFGTIAAPVTTATNTMIAPALTSTPSTSISFGAPASIFSSSSSLEKTSGFSFGATSTTVSTPATTAPFSAGSFSFGTSSIASTAPTMISTSSSSISTGGFSFGGGFQTATTSSTATSSSNQPIISSAPSLFSSVPSGSMSGFNFQTPVASTSSTATTTTTSTPFAFGASSSPRSFAPSVISSNANSSAPAFGSTSSFGAAAQPTTAFSGFGSSSTSGLFTFGASNPSSSTAVSTGSSSGFAFSATPATPATSLPTLSGFPSMPTFGSTPSSIAFGSGTTSSSGSSPFQFGATSTIMSSNPLLVQPSVDSNENNPFSISQETSSGGKRQVIKAKRRAGKP